MQLCKISKKICHGKFVLYEAYRKEKDREIPASCCLHIYPIIVFVLMGFICLQRVQFIKAVISLSYPPMCNFVIVVIQGITKKRSPLAV